MSNRLDTIQGQPLTSEQQNYLEGFFAGVTQRGFSFGDLAPLSFAAQPKEDLDGLTAEERMKREEHPLDSYYRIVDNALHNTAPDKEDTFRFKWNGLFFLTPVKDAFMSRLRIPGGVLRSYQLREIARTARDLTTGYIQITTRANLQLRLIQPKDAPEFLSRIQGCGLHTRGAGADNIRNLTANPTAGIDPYEVIDVLPYCREIGQQIINHRDFYNLPRKFNIAFDGGGLIGSVEDTNDLGARAVKVGDEVFFRIAAGGATGHKSFAKDMGVLVPPNEIVGVLLAMVRVFIAKGNRTDRKKARLKHLLDAMPMSDFVSLTEQQLKRELRKGNEGLDQPRAEFPHSHVGTYPQKQQGLHYLGARVPVGHLTAKQLDRLADLADHYGSGEVRLTVWQNFIIPNVPAAYTGTVAKALQKMGFPTTMSNVSSGIIACTGSRYCKFAQSDTKGHALALIKHLEKKLPLDQPVNIHFTGCPNSCAQHYMGDIGLLGTKVKGEEGYHVFVGGGFGKNQAVGRQLFSGVHHSDVNTTIEKILCGYLKHRAEGESFQSFTLRHDLGKLQLIFNGDE
jgi:ferredoxin-nitrite reductase